MADFAANYSNRYKIRYFGHGKAHDLLIRYGRTAFAPSTELVEMVQDILDAASPLMANDWAIIGESYSIHDTDFFLPMPTTLGVVGSSGQGGTVSLSPNNFNFQGITSSGNRAMFYLFGTVFETLDNLPVGANNFRMTAAENVNVAAVIAVLNANDGNMTGADASSVIAWKNYANLNVNSYYQRKARG
jgi:hypothetical protein